MSGLAVTSRQGVADFRNLGVGSVERLQEQPRLFERRQRRLHPADVEKQSPDTDLATGDLAAVFGDGRIVLEQ